MSSIMKTTQSRMSRRSSANSYCGTWTTKVGKEMSCRISLLSPLSNGGFGTVSVSTVLISIPGDKSFTRITNCDSSTCIDRDLILPDLSAGISWKLIVELQVLRHVSAIL